MECKDSKFENLNSVWEHGNAKMKKIDEMTY